MVLDVPPLPIEIADCTKSYSVFSSFYKTIIYTNPDHPVNLKVYEFSPKQSSPCLSDNAIPGNKKKDCRVIHARRGDQTKKKDHFPVADPTSTGLHGLTAPTTRAAEWLIETQGDGKESSK